MGDKKAILTQIQQIEGGGENYEEYGEGNADIPLEGEDGGTVLVDIKARALYTYDAANDTELSFKEGDILHVTEQDESGWWFAEIDGRSGFVPNNYVEVVP